LKIAAGKGSGGDLAELKERLGKVETHVVQHEQKLASQQTVIEATNASLKVVQTTVHEHEEKLTESIYDDITLLVGNLKAAIEELKARLDELERLLKMMSEGKGEGEGEGKGEGEGESSGIDVSQLDKLIKSLRADLQGSMVKREDFEKLKKRVEDLEAQGRRLTEEQKQTQDRLTTVSKQTTENTEDIAKLKELLKAIEQKLANKVNCEDYDKLLALIKAG
jgi:DNA repair exonuclease SbcCD ATPase subunit